MPSDSTPPDAVPNASSPVCAPGRGGPARYSSMRGLGAMDERPFGDWVRYGDYAALRESHERLRAALVRACGHLTNQPSRGKTLRQLRKDIIAALADAAKLP